MKRLSTLILFAFVFTLATFAQEISADESLQRAVEIIRKKSYAKKVRGKADFALVHTEKCVSNGKALYYVFGKEKNDGFLITGADLRANSVLGFTENGTYKEALEIPAFRSWLEGCQEAMQWLSNSTAKVKVAKCPQFDIPERIVTNADKTISMTIPGRQYTMDATLPAKVEPLLGDVAWNQNDPYNYLCPDVTVEGIKESAATGCVATAVAQIMKYHEWPKQGTGSHRYISEGEDSLVLEADFSKSVYDWDNMLSGYEDEYNDEQANAVAKLMSDVGIAMDMEYGSASGTVDEAVPYALVTYFGYNKGIQLCYRDYYNYAEWNNLLKKEMIESGPVFMAASNMYEDARHAIVLDGYDEDGKYHINWGWGGLSNGYYDINFLNPYFQGIGGSRYGYPAIQTININCFPDKDGTSVAQSLIVVQEEVTMEDGTLYCQIANLGLAPYLSKVGYIAYIDNEIVGSYFLDVTEISDLGFMSTCTLAASLQQLGITPEMIGDKKCFVYPVYYDGTTYRVPLSKAAFSNHVVLGLDENGEINALVESQENTSPTCEKIEITRDFTGFKVKARAVISNKENCPTFDRTVLMWIYGEDEQAVAMGANFAYIDAGESVGLDFCCEPFGDKVMEEGKTYKVVLEYKAFDTSITIPGGTTTVTLKNPGTAPQPSFSNFKLDKTFVAQNEELTISFDVENTGGFGVQNFDFDIYRGGQTYRVMEHSMSETDIPNGKTKITATVKMDFAEGNYYISIYNGESEDSKICPDDLYFTIKNPETSISNVRSKTKVSDLYYDLQGRRVADPAKGIYIRDGKKIVKAP